MKEDLKTNPCNKKSMILTLISWRNGKLKRGVFSENINCKIIEIKNKIT